MGVLEFDAHFGDEIKRVKIWQPLGGGDEGYTVMIDNYYNGIILYRAGEWVCYLATKSQLTTADMSELTLIAAELAKAD